MCVGYPDTNLIISPTGFAKVHPNRRRMPMDLVSRAVTLSALPVLVNRGAGDVLCSDVVILPSFYGSCLKIQPVDVG